MRPPGVTLDARAFLVPAPVDGLAAILRTKSSAAEHHVEAQGALFLSSSLPNATKIPWMMASGRGGQPGM